MKVLILVDIQNDFCPGGALGVEEGDQTVAVANKLMAQGDYNLVVATQDYHPAGHISFNEWPVHCVQGTYGAELHADLDQSKIDHIVPKGTDPKVDSYSGFFDNDHKSETKLRSLIEQTVSQLGKGNETVEVHVLGLATDYCVKFTALDAKKLNYEVTVVLDGCRAVNLNAGDDMKALRELQVAGVEIAESIDLLPTPSRSRSVRQPGINLSI